MLRHCPGPSRPSPPDAFGGLDRPSITVRAPPPYPDVAWLPMSTTPQPGWHVDPHDESQVRYWSGERWTEARADRYEYRVLTQDDRVLAGKMNSTALESLLNNYASHGWRLITSVMGRGGGVASREQMLMILERRVGRESPPALPTPTAHGTDPRDY
jgi:hypothetical protein